MAQMSKKKRVEMFRRMELRVDKKGAEYLAYHSAFGPIQDYSPWTLQEYKEYQEQGLLN